jgi:hypothetical protein
MRDSGNMLFGTINEKYINIRMDRWR